MDLADVDPVAIARAPLLASERLEAALGGGGRVGPYNEPPYPCIRLTDPPGDDRDMRHLIAPLVQVEVYGDPDGSPGKPALRRILYIALQVLKTLPEQDYQRGEPVVTQVTSSGGGGWSPEPTGQPRYIATVRLHMHPGLDPLPAP